MDAYQTISNHFHHTIETIALSVDQLAAPMERASHALVGALLQDGKLIVCGNGRDASLAHLFSALLLGRYTNERPALPVITCGADTPGASAAAVAAGKNEIFARQLRALGQPGDVLLCCNSGESSTGLVRAVQAAHERNMIVIALSNHRDAELTTLLEADDIEICIPSEQQAHVFELHTMVLHCLCALIDQQLFGHYSEE